MSVLSQFGEEPVWPLPFEHLGQHPFAPTPVNVEAVDAFVRARNRVEFGPARRTLPDEIGKLATSQLLLADGLRFYDNRHFSSAVKSVDDPKLQEELSSGNVPIPTYLELREQLGVPSVELARFTTPYGLGHALIPDFHRHVRQGILEYSPDAGLHSPNLRRLEVVMPAVNSNGCVTALAFVAKLDHGTIKNRLPIKEKQLFMVRFDDESSLAKSESREEQLIAMKLKEVLTKAIMHEHDWRTPVQQSIMLKQRVIRHILNEYVDLPTWIVPLSSTFYVHDSSAPKVD